MPEPLPPCPECSAEYTYGSGDLLACPSCGHEWAASGAAIKIGTKVRNIHLIDGVGDHDIDCKVDGFGPMQLKSSVVKKA